MGKIENLPKWAQSEIKHLRQKAKSLESQLDRPKMREGDLFYIQTGYGDKGEALGYKFKEHNSVYMNGIGVRMNARGNLEFVSHNHMQTMALKPVCSNVVEVIMIDDK